MVYTDIKTNNYTKITFLKKNEEMLEKVKFLDLFKKREKKFSVLFKCIYKYIIFHFMTSLCHNNA